MRIDKIINNNIVSSFDKDGNEIVVMGRGIGFQKKSGQAIQTKDIEKIFHMDSPLASEQLKKLLADIPLEHIQTANQIVNYAIASLGKQLNKNIYISLTDHISFAMERYEKGMQFKNALLWEIKKFYHSEFEIGKKALDLIEENLKVRLPEDEAGSIALHIVNAELDITMEHAMDITKLIQNLINIVKYYYQIDLDEETLHYERFITHLKFFAQRLFAGKLMEDEDTVFLEAIKKQYHDDYKCTEKIYSYIDKEYGYQLSEEEMIYLTVHIKRVTKSAKN